MIWILCLLLIYLKIAFAFLAVASHFRLLFKPNLCQTKSLPFCICAFHCFFSPLSQMQDFEPSIFLRISHYSHLCPLCQFCDLPLTPFIQISGKTAPAKNSALHIIELIFIQQWIYLIAMSSSLANTLLMVGEALPNALLRLKSTASIEFHQSIKLQVVLELQEFI